MNTGDESNPSTSKPIRDRPKKGPAHLTVVDGFEESKRSDTRGSGLIEVVIDHSGDAANIVPCFASDPKLHSSVLKQRVFIGEHLFEIHQQGSHPERIVSIYEVTDIQKSGDITRGARQMHNFDRLVHAVGDGIDLRQE
jgi:hypothetical protein